MSKAEHAGSPVATPYDAVRIRATQPERFRAQVLVLEPTDE